MICKLRHRDICQDLIQVVLHETSGVKTKTYQRKHSCGLEEMKESKESKSAPEIARKKDEVREKIFTTPRND